MASKLSLNQLADVCGEGKRLRSGRMSESNLAALKHAQESQPDQTCTSCNNPIFGQSGQCSSCEDGQALVDIAELAAQLDIQRYPELADMVTLLAKQQRLRDRYLARRHNRMSNHKRNMQRKVKRFQEAYDVDYETETDADSESSDADASADESEEESEEEERPAKRRRVINLADEESD